MINNIELKEWIGVPDSSAIPVRLLEYLLLHITSSNENSVWVLSLACLFSALAPIIADCVGEQCSILGKVSWCEGDLELFRRSVLTFGVLVPGYNGAFTAVSCECVVPCVECDAIDWIYVCLLNALLFFTMALEAKVISFAHLILGRVYVFDAASSFNRANSVSLAISETCNRSRSELKWRLSNFFWVEVIALEARLEVPYVNEAVLMSGH